MNTVSGLMEEITDTLGYNPYSSFKDKNGKVVEFSSVLLDDDLSLAQDMYNSLVYECAKTVRTSSIADFFNLVNVIPFKDLYITGLMIEIYRRTHKNNLSVNVFYVSDEQYIEFTDWQDLLGALEQVKPHYQELQAYKGIESGISQVYQSMSDQHLLNAWFQRVVNEVTQSDDLYDFCDLNVLKKLSAQVDGLLGAANILNVIM